MVKHLPTMQETWVQSLGQEDPLKKEMATYSSTLAWKIPWTEEPDREAEVEWFYEDLQDLLELKPKKDVLFIIGDWNAKVGDQETPGVTEKFGLGLQNEAGQRLVEFCQENALDIANTLVQQHKRRLHSLGHQAAKFVAAMHM